MAAVNQSWIIDWNTESCAECKNKINKLKSNQFIYINPTNICLCYDCFLSLGGKELINYWVHEKSNINECCMCEQKFMLSLDYIYYRRLYTNSKYGIFMIAFCKECWEKYVNYV